ncbi:MAG: GEVED domain-containing protein, partial [bacterium]|nr:GEVED domain-containing protein [bacterium]
MKNNILSKFLFVLLLLLSARSSNAQYCTTTGAISAADDDISRVFLPGAFGTQINNSTSCYATTPQYMDYTVTQPGVSLIPGNTYTLTVDLSQCSGFFYNNACNVWIDYNRNFTFDAAELVTTFTASAPFPSTHSFSFLVPATATLGTSRMRLVQVEGGTAASIVPCATYTWGETEDYLVNLVSASGGGPVLPPIANFFPSQTTTNTIATDTVWINSPYDLVSTSTNTSRSYWDLPGESTLLPGYSRNPVAWTTQQYIDTAKYSQKFRYVYNRRGFWPVRLLAINTLKRDSLRDSVVKYIWVDTPSTTPKPNFFAARRKIGIGDYASMVDITSGGPNQWYWTFDPACNLCTTPPYFNNFFAGATDQN